MLRTQLAVLLVLATPVLPLEGQERDAPEGFVVRDPAVLANCTGCHTAEADGTLQRLSYMRKTPEGWEMSVRRMVTLYGVRLDTTAARQIVRYFSDHQGLAPDEVRPARFELERRMVDFSYTADTRTENTCRACHSMGRVLLQRRTPIEWELLVDTHRGLYPLVDNQTFRRNPPASPTPGETTQPMDHAITHLSRTFPLRTPEWTAWSATMRAPRLEGSWLVTGSEPGRGPLYGRMEVSAGAGEGEVETRIEYRHANGGPPLTREGRAIVYTGFQWRGRSTGEGAGVPPSLREVLFVEPGWQEMSGRWFTGGYDELGVDVSFTRVTGGALVAALAPRALQQGSSADVLIFGANLPSPVTPEAIDFGPGVTVECVVRATPDSITVHVTVASDAAIGDRDLFVAGASLRSGAVVYDRVDRLAISPSPGLARVGGIVFPKQLQQFEAIAYSDGPDRLPDTEDDVEIGPVDVRWSLEEYAVTYDDDDVRWVGTLSPGGLFTPAVDGPNPLRRGERNNIGDVWVVATYQPSGVAARPVQARALLIVTVPLYVRFDPWSAPR